MFISIEIVCHRVATLCLSLSASLAPGLVHLVHLLLILTPHSIAAQHCTAGQHSTMASSAVLSGGQVAAAQATQDFMIKPSSDAPVLDTSKWPLLLKNYDKYA